MYRFLLRPRWIGFHLLVIFGIVVMVNLGFWQLDRLDQRRTFNERVEQRIELPTEPLAALLASAGDDPDAIDDLEWRHVRTSGRYLPEEQLLVVNRSQNGRAGDNVVTPMRLDDGSILLVNRGFVPLGFDAPPAPGSGDEPTASPVTVEGVVRLSQERRLGQLSDPADGRLTEIQRIDVERLTPQLPGDVLPFYVDLLASSPPEAAGAPEPVIRPDLSDGSHLSYAVQWFIFAVAVAVGWVLAVRWSANRRAQESPIDVESATEPERTPIA